VAGTRQPRSSLGALFLFLAAIFAGMAYEAASSDTRSAAHWLIAVAAAVIGAWFVSLSVRAFRSS
jgi:hypothetical protein